MFLDYKNFTAKKFAVLVHNGEELEVFREALSAAIHDNCIYSDSHLESELNALCCQYDRARNLIREHNSDTLFFYYDTIGWESEPHLTLDTRYSALPCSFLGHLYDMSYPEYTGFPMEKFCRGRVMVLCESMIAALDFFDYMKTRGFTITTNCREITEDQLSTAGFVVSAARYRVSVMYSVDRDSVHHHYWHIDHENSEWVMPTCDVCNSPSWDLYNTADGKKVCRHCYNELYVRCQRCGSTVQRTTAEITRDNYALCPECAKRRTVLPYHRYYPKIQFFGNDHAKTVPMMGFELEIDDGGEDNRNAGIAVDILNSNALFGYCSHDGSLHDGFEIITQPATLEYHNSIKNVYNELCSKMKSLGYSSHDTTTCGFHVHVNRDFFGDSRENQNAAIRRLVFITEKFWNELVIYARRPEKRMEHYAKKIAPMEITEYMRRANQSHDHNFHYYALNIANEDTVEFRMFKGTLNVNTILATLQLVNNLCIVAKNNTLDEIRQMHFEDFVTSRVQKSYWKRRIGLPDTEE
jgi:DNA-directed RNA polymerase subunit RPC12/RpoP